MTKDQAVSFMAGIEAALNQHFGFYVFIPFPIQNEHINGKMHNNDNYFQSAVQMGKKIKDLGYTALVYEGNDQMPGGVMVAKSDDPKVRVFKKKQQNTGYPAGYPSDDANALQQCVSGFGLLSDLEPGSNII